MSSSTYSSVHLAQRPKANIIPGETFILKTHEAPKTSDLEDGEVLFQSLYLSLDPAMRGWLNGEFNQKLYTRSSRPRENPERIFLFPLFASPYITSLVEKVSWDYVGHYLRAILLNQYHRYTVVPPSSSDR